MTIYLVELQGYNQTTSSVETLRFCTGIGYTTKPTETPANAYFMPCIKQPALLQRDIFEKGTTYGRSQTSYGELVLINTGDLDYMVSYGFDGRKITIYSGEQHGSFPDDFSTVFKGTMDQPKFDWKSISIRLRDRQAELDVNIQKNKYLGNNTFLVPNDIAGVEGVAEDLKDKVKPLCYGKVYNISPPCVNTARLLYQVNDGAVLDVTAVYDRGVALTKGADYSSKTEMETTIPASGTYRVWKDGGIFRIGAKSQGVLTADVVQGSTASNRTVAQLVKSILTTKGGMTSSDISESDITLLDSLNSSEIGIWINEEVYTSEILDKIAASVGAWWSFDNLGVFRLQRLDSPSGTFVASFTNNEIIELQRLPSADTDRGIAPYRVSLKYWKNYTVQTDDLPNATSEKRNFLKEDYRTTKVEDLSVQTRHLLAPEMEFETLLLDSTAATAEATRRLNLYKVERDRLSIKVGVESLESLSSIDLGSVIQVRVLRFGYDSGKLFRIIGIKSDYRSSILELTLWG